jgi:branched-chain amino acid transport system permease protein
MQTFIGFTLGGIAVGAIYAIAASGLVVTYTTSGVFNFAHGAIGMVMAFLYWQLRFHSHVPAPAALFIVLFVAAPLLGALIEVVLIRRLNITDAGTTLVVTLGLLIFCMGVGYLFWPPTVTRTMPIFFGANRFISIGGTRVSYEQVLAVVLAIVVAGLLRLLFFQTRTGITMRAVVDDRDLTALNGATPAFASLLSWAIGAGLGALAGVLQASLTNSLNVIDLTFLIVNSFAAAMLGRLRSLPLTFAGALGLGLLDRYVTGYVHLTGKLQHLRSVLPVLFLFAVLLVLPAVRLRGGRLVGTRVPRVPRSRESALAAAVFVVVTAVGVNFLHGVNLTAAAQGISIGIFGLSLVVLTGYGGQVSLCQYSFVGLGAFVFARVAGDGNPLGLLVVAVIAAAVGALVALPALRLRGLYLALSTLAFAELAYFMFFLQPNVMGRSALKVHRLALPLFSVKTDRANVVMLAVAFSLLALMVLAIRRGPFGRTLGAMRDSEAACATLGLNLTVTKMAVFALSASMAAVGGALYGASQHTVTSDNFIYIQSLFLVLVIYIWGVNSPSGALLGGLSYTIINVIVVPHLSTRLGGSLRYLAVGLGIIGLSRYPSGVIGQWSEALENLRSRLGGRIGPGGPGQPPSRHQPAYGYSVREVSPVAATAD